MIISQKPITLAEAREFVKENELNKPLVDYFKDFTSLSKDKALSLKKELEAMNNHKVNEEKIIKIVDILPRDSEDLAKIFNDVSLSEEEVNSVLNITKGY